MRFFPTLQHKQCINLIEYQSSYAARRLFIKLNWPMGRQGGRERGEAGRWRREGGGRGREGGESF